MMMRVSIMSASNVSTRSDGKPCTQPLATSHCPRQRTQVTTRPETPPMVTDDPQTLRAAKAGTNLGDY